MNDILKRKGKFSISNGAIHAAGEDRRPLLRLFSKMIIVRAESDFMSDSIVYHAYSPLFRPVDEAGIVPEYKITLDAVYTDDQITRYDISAVEVRL